MIEKSLHSEHSRARCRLLALAAAVLVTVIAGATLIGGWILDVVPLRQLRPQYAVMVPSTAASFLALASVMLGRLLGRGPGRTLGNAVGLAVATVAGVNLALAFSGLAGTIDAVVMPGLLSGGDQGTAPSTAICFLLASVSLLAADRATSRMDRAFVWPATAGLLLALTATVGYAFDAKALYEVSIFTAMALHTAVAFILLFTALLLLRPDVGWIAVIAGGQSGSVGARRLLPIVVVVPFAFSLLALILTDAGLLNANFRLSLIAIATMAVLAATVVHNARLQNASERELLQLTDRLASSLRQRDLLLGEVYHRVKNNLQQINALLQLEASRVSDPVAKDSLRATTRRIAALGAVHRLLISSEVPSEVNSLTFLQDVATNALSTLPASDGRPVPEVEADEFLIHIDTAAVLGLLINELVTSMLGHSSPAGRFGPLRLKLARRDDAEVVLSIVQAGGGSVAQPGQRPAGTATSDRIVHGLVGQLNARLTPVNEPGLHGYEITISPDAFTESMAA